MADICQVLLPWSEPCSDSNQNSVLASHTVCCTLSLPLRCQSKLSIRWSNWEFYLEMLSSILELVSFSLSPTHAVVTAVLGRNMILGFYILLYVRWTTIAAEVVQKSVFLTFLFSYNKIKWDVISTIDALHRVYTCASTDTDHHPAIACYRV